MSWLHCTLRFDCPRRSLSCCGQQKRRAKGKGSEPLYSLSSLHSHAWACLGILSIRANQSGQERHRPLCKTVRACQEALDVPASMAEKTRSLLEFCGSLFLARKQGDPWKDLLTQNSCRSVGCFFPDDQAMLVDCQNVAENSVGVGAFSCNKEVYNLIAPLRAVGLLVSRELQGGAPKRYEHFMNILPTQATQWGL